MGSRRTTPTAPVAAAVVSDARGGEYFYFFCARKQDNACPSRYTQIEQIEDGHAIEQATVLFDPDQGLSERIIAEQFTV